MAEAINRDDPQTWANPETGPYWHAAAGGQLLLKHCTACDQAHWYPRHFCPHCGSDCTEWRESQGRGEVYTFTVMRRPAPRVIGYVTLDEGISIFTNIVDCDPDSLQIGQRVQARMAEQADGTFLPVFAPD